MYKKIERNTIHHHFCTSFVYLYTWILICNGILCCEVFVDNSTVNCISDVNLTEELLRQRDKLYEISKEKKIDYIKIYSPIDEIPWDVFHNISFKNIMIYNPKDLERIHKNAFIGNTKSYTEKFICYMNFETKLRNHPGTDYDLYEAIKKLKFLQTLYLSLATNMSHEIPDNTFTPSGDYSQNNLSFIEWYGYYTLSYIGSDIFYHLTHINTIIFKYVNINHIHSHTFRLDPHYDHGQYLNITFHSTSLTDDIFQEGVFSNNRRKVRLDLTNNSIKQIEEKIFAPFFNINDYNHLILSQNELNCSNTESFKWLFDIQTKFINRIHKALCDDDTPLTRLFPNWDSESTTISTQITTDIDYTVTESITETRANDGDTTTDIESTTSEATTVAETTTLETTESEDLTTVTGEGKTEPQFEPTSPQTTTNIPIISTKPTVTSTSTVSSTIAYSSTNLVTKPELSSSTSSPKCSESSVSNHSICQIIGKIEDLKEVTKTENYFNTSEELKDVMKDIQEIQISLDLMNDLDPITALNLTTNILNILSNLLNQDDAWINTTQTDKTSIASQILLQIQFSSFFLTCNQKYYNQTVDRIINDNIITDMYTNFNEGIHFEANNSLILIPEEVVHLNNESYCGNSSYAALITRLDEYLNESLSTDQNINTHVISYSMANTTDTLDLGPGNLITFSLRHKSQLKFGDQMICAFWDFPSMNWSTDGCELVISESNRDVTVCECNHLTNFAALMDVSNREKYDSTKSLLTNIFCGVSLFCLLLTIWLLLKPQRYNSNTITNRLVRTRTLITLNLSIMLSIADIFIIFGMDRKYNEALCKAMSGILLYSLLSSFAWMLLEGYHLYKMTVQVFDSTTRKLFLFLFGYGIPVVIIFIGFLVIWIQDSILLDALIGDYFCWISSAKYPHHIWLLIGPALTAVVFNLLMLILLIMKVFKSNSNPNGGRFGLRIKQLFGITSLLFNLGITWLSFILYINKFGSNFSYVFIVLNGSQGIFIFIYHLVIYLSKSKRLKNLSLRTSLKLTLSAKWSTKTIQTQLGDN